jgi:hypothetical protein
MCHAKNGQLCSDKNCKKCNDASLASIMNENNEIYKGNKSIKWSEKNEKSPREVTKGSNIKYIFVCKSSGHEFKAKPKKVKNGAFCPYPCCCVSSDVFCENISCEICFDATFISHLMSFNLYVKNGGILVDEKGIWSDKNTVNPRVISKKGRTECWLKCPKSKFLHEYKKDLNNYVRNGCPCVLCSGNPTYLCDDWDCNLCLEYSFASCDKSEYFSDENKDANGDFIYPRQIFKLSHDKYIFKCSKSNHTFEARLDNVARGSWCPYPCCNKTGSALCDDDKCKNCEKASFASSPRAIYFSGKNNLDPRKLRKSSHDEYIFVCQNKHEFKTTLDNINKGSWCPKCPYPDETECIEIIEKLTGEKFKKCRPSFLEKLELDGYNEDLKLAIEYNGEQHYKFSSLFHKKNLEEFEKQKERDIKKAKLCAENNIYLITIPYLEKKSKEKFILKEYNKYREKNNLPVINYDKKIFEKAEDNKEIAKVKKVVKKV